MQPNRYSFLVVTVLLPRMTAIPCMFILLISINKKDDMIDKCLTATNLRSQLSAVALTRFYLHAINVCRNQFSRMNSA